MIETLSFKDQVITLTRRPYLRSIRLNVQPSGQIQVSASRGTQLKHIYSVLDKYEGWLQKQLLKFQQMRAAFPAKDFCSGETYPLHGQNLTLDIQTPDDNIDRVFVVGHSLIIQSHDHSPSHCHKLLQCFYQQQGCSLLQKQIIHYSQVLQLYPNKISYRAATSRWGSCSRQGHISLNWKLVIYPLEVINYVIIHELCHLKHLNHSKDFWNLVEKHCPSFKTQRKLLRQQQLAAEFLSKPSPHK